MPDKMKSVEKVAASPPAQTFAVVSERNASQAVGNMTLQPWPVRLLISPEAASGLCLRRGYAILTSYSDRERVGGCDGRQ